MIPVDLLNYQLIRLIGRGGMGEVYLARNKNIEQYVAVKALHPQYANNPSLRARFKQEAVMLNSLNHPNIVKFLNFVENEYGVFLIMEYIDGITLEDYISKKNGLIVEEKAYPMMMEILSAFSYAHQRGIVHRDIKPSNIFLDKEGHIKVMDFGIAQIMSEVDCSKTGNVAGTPAYMSPEQVYGHKLDQRSDIYSLGVLLHQMMTGRAPYDSTTMSQREIKSLVVSEKLPKMKNYYPYVSDGMQLVVDKATMKNSEERYENCDDMAKAIKHVLKPEKRSLLPIIIGVAAVLVAATVGLGVWDYFRTKVEYYKDYAEFYGVPVGIGSLSSSEMEHRAVTYRIESSKRKVRRLTLVNGKGKPVRHTDTEHINSRYTDIEFYYNDNGDLDYKKVYDEYGKLLYKIDYDENMKVAMFKHDDEHGTAKRLQSSTTELHSINGNYHSSITRYLLTYSDDGLLEKMEYATGEDNVPVGDAENIYGQAYSYDEKGRVTEVSFLGSDGKVRSNNKGLAIKRYKYNEDDDWIEVAYFSENGKPSHDGTNCSVVKIEYDQWGNRLAEYYYSAEGHPACRTDMLAYGLTYEYNNEGCCVKRTYLDNKHEAGINKYGFAISTYEYNEDNYLIEEAYFDKNGNRANFVDNDKNSYSIGRMDVDDNGLVLSYAIFNTLEQPIESVDGVHKRVMEYDEQGNITAEKYYNKEEKPTKYKGFYSSANFEYNELNQMTTVSYLDESGKLTYDENGIAIVQRTFNPMGNVTKYEYLDKDGHTLVNSKWGYAVEETTYDAIGNMKAVHYYNSAKEPCMYSREYSTREWTYDPKTNFVTERTDWDANNHIITKIHYVDNKQGNHTKVWETDHKDKLKGVVWNYEYKNNKVVKRYATDLSGRRVNVPEDTFCETRVQYDDNGNVTEMSFFDTKGERATNKDKIHRWITRYNEFNQKIYEKNLDKDNKPVSGAEYDAPEVKYTYDDHGNQTSLAMFDGQGSPFTCWMGFHRLEWRYNDYNLRESLCYKNENGYLVEPKDNNSPKITYAYDSRRRLIQEKHFKTDGSLNYIVRVEYNEQNSMTDAYLCDVNGNQDDSKYGFSRMHYEYLEDGVTPTKMTFYKKNGSVFGWRKYNAQTGEWGSFQR